MASYVVMQPPRALAAEAEAGAVLVRDGFSVLAFLFPPLWLVWHRLWIEAAFALAIMMALTALGEVAGFGLTGSALSLLVSIFVGLEGTTLRVNALRRRGWHEAGVVVAKSADEAEIRYAADLVDEGEEPVAPAALPWAHQHARPAQSGPALGLFHYPGKP